MLRPDSPAFINAFINRRNKAFEEDDIEWAVSMAPAYMDREVVEMGFHKARAVLETVSSAKRAESRRWLSARNLKGYGEL